MPVVMIQFTDEHGGKGWPILMSFEYAEVMAQSILAGIEADRIKRAVCDANL